jgi:hypothetical protein
MVSLHTTNPRTDISLKVVLLLHLALFVYFLANLAKDFFFVDPRAHSNIYLIAGHLLEAVGGTVINAFLMFVLRRRHYDTSLLWAYIVCVAVMTVGCVAGIVRSIQFAVRIIHGHWAGTPTAPAAVVAIIVSIMLLFETVFQVRTSLNTMLIGSVLMAMRRIPCVCRSWFPS